MNLSGKLIILILILIERKKEFVHLPCVWKIENFTFFFFNSIVDLNLGCFHWKHQKILVELQSF